MIFIALTVIVAAAYLLWQVKTADMRPTSPDDGDDYADFVGF